VGDFLSQGILTIFWQIVFLLLFGSSGIFLLFWMKFKKIFKRTHILEGEWFGRWSEFRRENFEETDEVMIRRPRLIGSKCEIREQKGNAIQYEGRIFILFKRFIFIIWSGGTRFPSYNGASLGYLDIKGDRILGFWVGPSLEPSGGGAITIGPWVSGRTPVDRDAAWDELHERMHLTLDRYNQVKKATQSASSTPLQP
jgi:hypothetical protein